MSLYTSMYLLIKHTYTKYTPTMSLTVTEGDIQMGKHCFGQTTLSWFSKDASTSKVAIS